MERPAQSHHHGRGDDSVGARPWCCWRLANTRPAPIRRAVEGEVSATVAASYLQQHPSARIVIDTAAASELTRFKTPWLLGPLEQFGMKWDAKTDAHRRHLAGDDCQKAAAEAAPMKTTTSMACRNC